MPSPFLLSRAENKEPASGIFCPPIFERREEPRQILIIFSQGSFYLYSKSNSSLSIRSKRKITPGLEEDQTYLRLVPQPGRN
jgi:hypothetical protein